MKNWLIQKERHNMVNIGPTELIFVLCAIPIALIPVITLILTILIYMKIIRIEERLK
ncbi:MAG: hypothetical protein ACM3PY_06870 [Omnitrophica WOR_2 bacterium]